MGTNYGNVFLTTENTEGTEETGGGGTEFLTTKHTKYTKGRSKAEVSLKLNLKT